MNEINLESYSKDSALLELTQYTEQLFMFQLLSQKEYIPLYKKIQKLFMTNKGKFIYIAALEYFFNVNHDKLHDTYLYYNTNNGSIVVSLFEYVRVLSQFPISENPNVFSIGGVNVKFKDFSWNNVLIKYMPQNVEFIIPSNKNIFKNLINKRELFGKEINYFNFNIDLNQICNKLIKTYNNKTYGKLKSSSKQLIDKIFELNDNSKKINGTKIVVERTKSAENDLTIYFNEEVRYLMTVKDEPKIIGKIAKKDIINEFADNKTESSILEKIFSKDDSLGSYDKIELINSANGKLRKFKNYCKKQKIYYKLLGNKDKYAKTYVYCELDKKCYIISLSTILAVIEELNDNRIIEGALANHIKLEPNDDDSETFKVIITEPKEVIYNCSREKYFGSYLALALNIGND